MKPTTRDNLLYLGIALSIVAALGLVLWYQDSHDQRLHFPLSDKMVILCVTTVGVFGALISTWKRAWRQTRFWLLMLLLLVAFIPLQWFLAYHAGLRMIVFIPLSALEAAALSAICNKYYQR